MKANHRRVWTAFVATLSSVPACAAAADAQAEAPFWSAGVGTVSSRVHIEGGSGRVRSSNESGYVIRGGFRLTENLAVDLAYLRTRGFAPAATQIPPSVAT
jgi:hypothetical protein